MKLNLTTLTLNALFAAALTACGQQAPLPMQAQQPVRVQSMQQATQTRQLIVRFRGQMSRAMAAEFNAKYGLHILQFIPSINAYIVEVDTQLGLKAERVVSYLLKDALVEHAELNIQVQVAPVGADMHTMPVLK